MQAVLFVTSFVTFGLLVVLVFCQVDTANKLKHLRRKYNELHETIYGSPWSLRRVDNPPEYARSKGLDFNVELLWHKVFGRMESKAPEWVSGECSQPENQNHPKGKYEHGT